MIIISKHPEVYTNLEEISQKTAITESESFKFKSRFLNNTNNAGTINVEVTVPLKYLSNFWGTLETSLINCETILILTLSANCLIFQRDRVTTFALTDKNLYVSVVYLSSPDITKALQQLKSRFKCLINWNKYQSKVVTQVQNQYLDYLINPNFQRVIRLFVLLFKANAHQTRHIRNSLPIVEIKEYNVMIDGKKNFDQLVKNNLRTYDNFQKIRTVEGDDYATACLLDYLYFNEHNKMTAKI